jgi:uncharacterized protein with PQ loop repeat
VSYHDVAHGVGWLAVVLTVWGSLAQFRHIVGRGATGVSLSTWTIFSYLSCFWVSYGVEQRSAVIVLGSALVFPFQVGVVWHLKPWRSWDVFAYATLFSVLVCLVATLAWGWSAGVFGAGVAMVLTRGPQIVGLVRHPDASGVSVSMWVLSGCALGCWMIYYQNSDRWAAFASVSCAALASVVIIVLASWRHRRAHEAVLLSTDVAVA